jgi:hypothetical protein
LSVAVVMLFILCLIAFPYVYYQVLRWVAFVAFTFLGSYYAYYRRYFFCAAFFLLAVLFQPIYKISFDRTIWKIIDVFVTSFLFYVFLKVKVKRENDDD